MRLLLADYNALRSIAIGGEPADAAWTAAGASSGDFGLEENAGLQTGFGDLALTSQAMGGAGSGDVGGQLGGQLGGQAPARGLVVAQRADLSSTQATQATQDAHYSRLHGELQQLSASRAQLQAQLPSTYLVYCG